MTSLPPGWYDDGRGSMRWWDGTAWTEHVAAPDPVATPEQVPASGQDAEQGEALPPELAGLAGFAEQSGGAFVAATEPQRSKVWIVWVVLGVVLLGIVIAAAVLIPLMFLNLATSTSSVTPESADERAAVASVEQYNDAWLEGDCDAYFASTTENLRDIEGIVDCPSFEEAAQYFGDSVEDYSVAVTGIEASDSGIDVETAESYGSFIDQDGELVDESQPFVDRWTYTVISEGDTWVIDEVS